MPGSYAPLAGEVVWLRKHRWRVEALRVAGEVSVLDVTGPEGGRTFLAPFDRPSLDRAPVRHRRVGWPHARATLLALAARRYTLGLPLAALDAKCDLLPYQLEPTLCLLAGSRRVLVADDVGLGKTVQAGVAIAETMRSGPGAMVLVLVPASVRAQWAGELRQRFALEARLADAANLRHLAGGAWRLDSPWQPGVWLATPDFIKQPHVIAALPPRAWDLIVIDEAHDVAGASDRHVACDALARRARRVLLLTATPHSGDPAAFARLCALGAFDDHAGCADDLTVFRRTPATLGWASRRRTRWRHVTITRAETDAIDALLDFEQQALRAAGPHRPATLLLLSVLRKRALSTMAALAESVRRRAAWLEAGDTGEPVVLQARLPFQDDVIADDFHQGEDAALSSDIGMRRTRERAWLRRLQALAERAARDDSRLRTVVASVIRAREPVVIFTEFRHSLDALLTRLRVVASVAAIHGGLTSAERQREMDRYLRGDASVLLATDVAGQGLNLQSRGRWVIHLEVPWNPARLAQRAGRVDRIGQARAVHVTILSSAHRAEAALIAHVRERARRANQALGGELAGVRWPTDTEVGAALVDGEPIPDVAEAPPVAVSTAWRRRAEWLVRRLLERRRWARHWQGDALAPRRALKTSQRGRDRLARGGRVLVFSASLIDSTGGVVEAHLAAYRVPPSSVPPAAAVEGARVDIVRRLTRRCARVRGVLDSRAKATAAVDRAIERELRVVRAAWQRHPGLFDEPVERPSNGPALVVTPMRTAAHVTVGRVALVCVLADAR